MAREPFFRTSLLVAAVAAPLLLTSTNANAYAGGAPSQACRVTADFSQITMNRTKTPTTGDYTLAATALSYVPGGDAIDVTLTNIVPNATFAGVSIIVTQESTDTHAGTLSAPNNGHQVASCPGGGARVTHQSATGDVETVTFTWTPPANSVGDVAVKAYVLDGSRANNAGQAFYRLVEGDGALILTAEEVDAGPGDVDAGPGDDDAGPGDVDAGPGDVDAGVEPEDDAGVEPEDDAGVEPEDDAGVEPEDDAGVEPEDDAGVEPEDDAGVEPEDDAGVEPEDDAGVEPEDDAGVEPEQEPEDDAGVEPEQEPEDDAGPGEPEDDAGPGGGTPGGCACDASPAPADGFALMAFALGLLAIRRRRKR